MPTDDEQLRSRPLMLAIRSLKLLAAVCVGYGVFFVVAYGYLNRYDRYRPYFIVMGMVLWVVPGALYLVNATQIQLQRRRGAAVSAMIVAIVQAMCAAALFAANFIFTPISPIPVVMSALWVLALIQLIANLRRSLPLLQIDAERHHGFEVQQVQPPTPAQSIDNVRAK